MMTLAELVEAIKRGDAPTTLTLDNDQVTAYDPEDEHGMPVFYMHPSELLKQALTLLGVPWEQA